MNTRKVGRNLGASVVARQTHRRLLHRVMLKSHRSSFSPRRFHLGVEPVSVFNKRAKPDLFLQLIEPWQLPESTD
jgi:hypothetical protein